MRAYRSRRSAIDGLARTELGFVEKAPVGLAVGANRHERRSGGSSPQRTLPTPRMRALDPPIRKAARRGRGPLDPTNRRTSSLPRDAPCRPARPLQGSEPSGAISECLGDRRDRRAVLPRPPMHSLLPEKAAAVNREARRVQGYQSVNAGPGGAPKAPGQRLKSG